MNVERDLMPFLHDEISLPTLSILNEIKRPSIKRSNIPLGYTDYRRNTIPNKIKVYISVKSAESLGRKYYNI